MNDVVHRFFGGSPMAVLVRLILLSILVGVVLAALGFDPQNLFPSLQRLIMRIWDMGWDAVNWAWKYFILGALLVIPVWLIVRVVKMQSQQRT
jgi:Family of unknown function (DUF6460)